MYSWAAEDGATSVKIFDQEWNQLLQISFIALSLIAQQDIN